MSNFISCTHTFYEATCPSIVNLRVCEMEFRLSACCDRFLEATAASITKINFTYMMKSIDSFVEKKNVQ